MTSESLSQERLKEILHYNPDTGAFTWIDCARNGWNGRKANSQHGNGYIKITINRRIFLAHRLAWLYMIGEFPESEIDHIDHVRSNNKFGNLRSVDRATNSKNISIPSDNKTGVIGVHRQMRDKKWIAKICINRKEIYIGSEKDFFEAVCLRKSSELKYNFHKNHGETP